MRTCKHCGDKLDNLIDSDDIVVSIGNVKLKSDLCFDCRKELVNINKRFLTKRKKKKKGG
jgi:hypothetical protein